MTLSIGTQWSLVADRWPARTAIVQDDGREFTYRELDARIAAAAGGMEALGVGPGDRVAILLPNTVEFAVAHMGALGLGAVSVPINVRLAADEVRFIVEDSGSDLLVFDTAFDDAVSRVADELDVDTVSVGDGGFEELLDAGGEPTSAGAGASDTAIIAYTSGSTGRPKGIPHVHESTVLGASQVIQEMSVRRDDRALHIAPLFHTVDLHCFFNPHWVMGATNVLQRSFDAEAALELIDEHDITGILGVPAQVRALNRALEDTDADTSSLRYVRTGGDAITERTIERARAGLGADFYNTYGLTEAHQNVTVHTPSDSPEKRTSVGKAAPFWNVRVVESAPPGEANPAAEVSRPGRGMILVSGPTITEGYLNRPEETADLFVGDGWIYTGDVADIDEDGYISIVDRLDNMIKSGGENVYPQEIETVLADHEAVADCGVFAIDDPGWGQTVAAAVVRGGAVVDADLDEYLRTSDRVADFKRPRTYVFVDEIPRNPGSGSIQRATLPDLIE